MLHKHQAIFLGLSIKEQKILEALEINPKSLFTLSREINIPRGTLYPIIKKLFEREFVVVKNRGKRFLYKCIEREKLAQKLQEVIHSLDIRIDSSGKDLETMSPIKKRGWLKSLFDN